MLNALDAIYQSLKKNTNTCKSKTKQDYKGSDILKF